MTHITRHVQIPTGYDSDGKPEFLTVGFLTEENFGKGNMRRRVWLHTSVLNPVLFQQVRPFVGKSSHVMLEHVDLRRKYKGPDMPADDGGEAESDGASEGKPTDAAQGVPTNVAEAVEKLRALMPGIPDAVADVRQANVIGRTIADVIALLGSGMLSLAKFEEMLVQSGVINRSAIEDAEGYDGGALKKAVADTFSRLRKPNMGGGEV